MHKLYTRDGSEKPDYSFEDFNFSTRMRQKQYGAADYSVKSSSVLLNLHYWSAKDLRTCGTVVVLISIELVPIVN